MASIKPYKRALCWLRRDLRLNDQRALATAAAQAQEVVVFFIFDRQILDKLENPEDRRLTFIHRCLAEVDQQLQRCGSQLVVGYGTPPQDIATLATHLEAEALFCSRDYEPDAKQRDQAVAQALARHDVVFHTVKDQVIFEGGELTTQAGQPFKVFTPFKRAWLQRLEEEHVQDWQPQLDCLATFLKPTPDVSGPLHHLPHPWATLQEWPLERLGFRPQALWLDAGEHAALRRLQNFAARLDGYAAQRDFPADDGGTSGLSAHLRFGTLSIRTCVRHARAAIARSASEDDAAGAAVWLSELIWRDFYQMILDCNPHVVTGAFRPQYDAIKWPGSDQHFEAWCAGHTGYPIVDAAMRHFNQTGWMHNRLRMVVASFLVKDLLVDWRKGAAYFARHLLDFDLAANNGGWQWCASTGCDAQPYFRIFNPVSQARRFDPNGTFIRTHLPELANYPDRFIHFPAGAPVELQERSGCVVGRDYPAPLVDHAVQRQNALALYGAAR